MPAAAPADDAPPAEFFQDTGGAHDAYRPPMTLAQLAAAFFMLLVLGTLALALDWSSTLVAMDDAAVEIARRCLRIWSYVRRALPG